MKKIIFYTLVIIFIFFLQDSYSHETHINPLENEYSSYSEPLPSFGFAGGPYLAHTKSAYVSSFWSKVSYCQYYYGGTLNSGYRCPSHNAHEGGGGELIVYICMAMQPMFKVI